MKTWRAAIEWTTPDDAPARAELVFDAGTKPTARKRAQAAAKDCGPCKGRTKAKLVELVELEPAPLGLPELDPLPAEGE